MKCPQCSFETESEQGFKSHLTKSHGGFSVDDLKGAGITPTQRDIARALAGNTSAREVTEQAPDAEPRPGEGTTTARAPRTRRPRAPEIDPEVERAKERILRARCERIASLPYSLLAGICGDESIRLSTNEKIELTEAYVTLSKAYGWEGTSKLLLWGDVMICHAAIVGQKERKEALFQAIGFNQQPEAVQEETAAAEQAEPTIQ